MFGGRDRLWQHELSFYSSRTQSNERKSQDTKACTLNVHVFCIVCQHAAPFPKSALSIKNR